MKRILAVVFMLGALVLLMAQAKSKQPTMRERVDDLEREVAGLNARLKVVEAKPIPVPSTQPATTDAQFTQQVNDELCRLYTKRASLWKPNRLPSGVVVRSDPAWVAEQERELDARIQVLEIALLNLGVVKPNCD